jgi:hypothetical protein
MSVFYVILLSTTCNHLNFTAEVCVPHEKNEFIAELFAAALEYTTRHRTKHKHKKHQTILCHVLLRS